MTQEEFLAATEEEIEAEIERCKDPRYVYNTYWTLPDGSKPRPLSKEEWDQKMADIEHMAFNRFKRYRKA